MKTFTLAALVLYAVLGTVDFYETYDLIRHGDGAAYESNPVAATWLKDYGWKGLAVYKLAVTFLVATIVLLVRRYRPRTAAAIAALACLSLVGVTLYSRHLLATTQETGPG